MKTESLEFLLARDVQKMTSVKIALIIASTIHRSDTFYRSDNFFQFC